MALGIGQRLNSRGFVFFGYSADFEIDDMDDQECFKLHYSRWSPKSLV